MRNPTIPYLSHSELISEQINTQFYLPITKVETHLSNYYILHWQGTYISSRILSSHPVYEKETITRDGITYLVGFDPTLSAWELSQNLSDQYKLSFRKQQGDKYGTVLIRKLGI